MLPTLTVLPALNNTTGEQGRGWSNNHCVWVASAIACVSSIYLPHANRLNVSFFTRMSFFNTIVGFSVTTPVNCGVSMYFHEKSLRQ